MRILIAPNAMKGSLSATGFANAISEGLLLANPSFKLVKCPLGDGGDGTAELLVEALNGVFVPVSVHDPLGRIIGSRYGWLDDSKCAIIEMAEASGIKLLNNNELNPMKASTRGTGELILEAVKRGARKIILGIGGSATVDGGIGMVKALGFELLGTSGKEIDEGGDGLIQLNRISTENALPELFNCEFVIACDVKNPLLGENGAAAVYGPQKGASESMVNDLELGFQNYLGVLEKFTQKVLKDTVGGGAAGGIALPLIGFLNARMVSGAELLIDLLGIINDLKGCDLVITGEGCIDLQTCQGKGPAVIANAAREASIPVIAIGGSVKAEASWLFDGIFSVSQGPASLEDTMRNAYELTKSCSYELGKLLLKFQK